MLGSITELRAALLRIVGTESTDPELVLRDEAVNEVLDIALLVGLYNTQRYLIDIGCGDDWLTNAELSFGAADDTGARSAEPPVDLLRFAGDLDYPSLYRTDGHPWGTLVRDIRTLRAASGDAFYWSGTQIWVPSLASVPDGVRIDYYRKLALPELEDEEDEEQTAEDIVLQMAEDARALVPADAAMHAIGEYWVPAPDGRATLEDRITKNWQRKRTDVAALMRRTGGRQMMNEGETVGNHYFYR